MLLLVNCVVGNCFIFYGQEIVLFCYYVDEYFFFYGDGWLQCWDIIECGVEYCVLQLCWQYVCGFDYLVQFCYQLLCNQLIVELMFIYYGEVFVFYGCGFYFFFFFDECSKVQFQVSGYWLEGENYLFFNW